MKIGDIRKPRGANRSPKRVGRGSGSGVGKTCGRGANGAGQRSGPALRAGFEGGQMALIRRLPKRGFTNVGRKVYQIVNVESLNRFRKDTSVDRKALKEAGLIRSIDAPVKILGEGKISKALHIALDAFSESARKKIQEAGGKAEIARADG